MDTDQTFSGSTSDEGDDPNSTRAETQQKKRSLLSMDTLTQPGDELLPKYYHVRESIRKVQPEFYETVDKLKSCYHMSESHAAAAFITVDNKMFGRILKQHDQPEIVDLDTLPETYSV